MLKKLLLIILLSPVVISAQDSTYRPGQIFTAGDSIPATCTVGGVYFKTTTPVSISICTATNTWTTLPTSSGTLPSGLIGFVVSGFCPTGFTESSALNGKTLFGTVTANGDVGTTGGNDNITPTVNSLTAAAQVFTGASSTAIVNHLHTLATGTGTTGNFAQVIGTVDASSGGTGGTPTQTALGTRSGNPVGGVASYTPTGTNGTSAVTGTMNSFDNRSAFTKVIFCVKD